MRAREPVAQLRGRLVGRFTVKGHQRDGDPRNPDDLGAPPVIRDKGDLNKVRTTGDQGFEALYYHGSSLEFVGRKIAVFVREWKASFYLWSVQKQAKERTKAASPRHRAQVQERFDRKKIYVSCSPQEMHGTYTVFQQTKAGQLV